MESAPNEASGSSIPNGASSSVPPIVVTIGTVVGVVVFVVIVAIVIYFFRRTLCFTTPRTHTYPEAAAPPNPTACFTDVEGVVLVDDANSEAMRNRSIALTLIHSSDSSCSEGGETRDPTKSAHFDPLECHPMDYMGNRNATEPVASPSPRYKHHYPKEIHDASTNSVYKLYKRRSSKLVYGSSTYNSMNASVDGLLHRMGAVHSPLYPNDVKDTPMQLHAMEEVWPRETLTSTPPETSVVPSMESEPFSEQSGKGGIRR